VESTFRHLAIHLGVNIALTCFKHAKATFMYHYNSRNKSNSLCNIKLNSNVDKN